MVSWNLVFVYGEINDFESLLKALSKSFVLLLPHPGKKMDNNTYCAENQHVEYC